jgi:hypothetical protein
MSVNGGADQQQAAGVPRQQTEGRGVRAKVRDGAAANQVAHHHSPRDLSHATIENNPSVWDALPNHAFHPNSNKRNKPEIGMKIDWGTIINRSTENSFGMHRRLTIKS